MNKNITIALVDDEDLILEGINLILSNVQHINVGITSNSGDDFIHALEDVDTTHFPDVVLVDIQMQPMDGFELVELLKNNYPDLKIIVLSSHYKSNILGYMINWAYLPLFQKQAAKKYRPTPLNRCINMGFSSPKKINRC